MNTYAPYLEALRGKEDALSKNKLYSIFGLNGFDLNWETAYKPNKDVEHPKLLIGGCSFTFGEGVPYEMSWGHQLAKTLKLEDNYLNISGVGWGIHEFAKRMLNYMYHHGNPEYVVFLAPELFRGTFFVDGKNTLSRLSGTDSEHHLEYDLKPLTLSGRERLTWSSVKYSKKPHILEDVLSFELVLQQSLEWLSRLLMYCYQSNIKVAWGTWDAEAKEFFNYIKSLNEFPLDFSSYTPLPTYAGPESLLTEPLDDCHKDLEEEHKGYFTHGFDKKHSGVHYHAHWAEELYSKLK